MKTLVDLHTHTVVSGHAYSTLQENILSAKEKGLKYLGMSEHAPEMPGGAHLFYFSNIRVVPRKVDGVILLRGCEVNILDYNGNIDLPERELNVIDYAIASLHPPCIEPGTVEENTNAIINVMDIEKVKIIGHPDDSRFPLDYKKLVLAAKEKDVLLEINNSSLKPLSFREGARENVKVMLELCKEMKAKIILGSDAHISYSVGDFQYAEELLKELCFPDELVVNYSEADIKKYFLGE
ncbi:MAG: phosphatase [Fusobacteriaceae bacterium]